eukprot:5728691-Alexandrium_andersonii.AAC.1
MEAIRSQVGAAGRAVRGRGPALADVSSGHWRISDDWADPAPEAGMALMQGALAAAATSAR